MPFLSGFIYLFCKTAGRQQVRSRSAGAGPAGSCCKALPRPLVLKRRLATARPIGRGVAGEGAGRGGRSLGPEASRSVGRRLRRRQDRCPAPPARPTPRQVEGSRAAIQLKSRGRSLGRSLDHTHPLPGREASTCPLGGG